MWRGILSFALALYQPGHVMKSKCEFPRCDGGDREKGSVSILSQGLAHTLFRDIYGQVQSITGWMDPEISYFYQLTYELEPSLTLAMIETGIGEL